MPQSFKKTFVTPCKVHNIRKNIYIRKNYLITGTVYACIIYLIKMFICENKTLGYTQFTVRVFITAILRHQISYINSFAGT